MCGLLSLQRVCDKESGVDGNRAVLKFQRRCDMESSVGVQIGRLVL